MTQPLALREAVPAMDETTRPGWRLHLTCVVCGTEAMFAAVVMSLAADKAVKAGWHMDREALHASAHDRYATCPDHTPDSTRH